jgi:hypothetical protein
MAGWSTPCPLLRATAEVSVLAKAPDARLAVPRPVAAAGLAASERADRPLLAAEVEARTLLAAVPSSAFRVAAETDDAPTLLLASRRAPRVEVDDASNAALATASLLRLVPCDAPAMPLAAVCADDEEDRCPPEVATPLSAAAVPPGWDTDLTA